MFAFDRSLTYFSYMREALLFSIIRNRSVVFLIIMLLASVGSFAQSNSAPKEIFRDSDGNLISNNEFVDIRMANFMYRDATIVTMLPNGQKEFRLQKVPQEGMAAPDFDVKTIDGKGLTLAELRGKVVVLNFWFIGCPACRGQEPKLNDLKAKFGDRSDVIFIAMTPDPAADVKRYLAKERFDYMHVADAAAIMKPFHFLGYPKNIVISKTGEMVYWRSTIHAWDKFESVIRAELAKD